MKTHVSKKIWCGILLLWMLFFAQWTMALTITKPTWWQNVSADYAADWKSPNRKSLWNIVITEANTTAWKKEFVWSQTNKTLIFSAPTDREFREWTWRVTYKASRDITSASIVVTSTEATVTFSTDSTPTLQDALTMSLLYVRPKSGKYPPKLQYIMRLSSNPGTAAISGITNDSTQFANLSMITWAINKLVIIMPWQAFSPGIWAVGDANSQMSWKSFVIPSIYATDQFFNVQPTYLGAKTLTWAWPIWTNTYTTAVTFASGVSSTTLNTTIKTAQTTALAVRQSTSYGYTWSTFIVSNAVISIGSPTSQTMPSVTSSTSSQNVSLTPSWAGNYFYVDDQKWLDAWYYTTISCSSLTSSGNIITNKNISLSTDGTIDLISGTWNPRVVSDIGTSSQMCDSTLTFIRRNNESNFWILGKYGQFLNIHVTIPARQSPWNYQGTIVFTLIEN